MDEHPKHPKCTCHPRRKETVLTLDGGGIRGHASLLILKHIMTLCRDYEHECDRRDRGHSHAVEELDEELPLPCHYFDYMFGTSTGGIIAIMLGRLRMSIDDCIDVYRKFGKDIFGKKHKLWWIRYNKYKAGKVESFMNDVVEKHCPDIKKEGPPMLFDPTVRDNEEDDQLRRQRHRYVPCRVAVFAGHQATHEELFMFRSYHNPTPPNIKKFGQLLNLKRQIEVKICDAARATSAAPTYFDPMRIEGSDFMDGGLWANNPTDLAWWEVDSMHKSNLGRDCRGTHGGIFHLVNIGTGKGARRDIDINADRIRRAISLVRRSVRQMTDPEPVHDYIELMDNKWYAGEVYTRFNLDKGLEKIKLDEFIVRNGVEVTLEQIGGVVRDYFDSKTSIFKNVAKNLVDHRRDRCKPDWRRYQGLTRAGRLEQHWLEKFLWDDTTPDPQSEPESFTSPSQSHEMTASSPGSHPCGISNGHHGIPELMTGLGINEPGYEMSSSPVQGPGRHASENSAANPRFLHTDASSLMPSQGATTPTLSQGRCSCSTSSRESQPSSSRLSNNHELSHSHSAPSNGAPIHMINGTYASSLDNTYK